MTEFIEIKRDVCMSLLKDYYQKQNRIITPDYENYSCLELKKCLILFRIPYVEPNLSPQNTKKQKNGSRNKPKVA